MAKRANVTLIGGFVVGAAALVVLGITLFGSGRLFRETHEYVLYFDSSVNGLTVGAPVKFKGVEVGSVKDILLSLDGQGFGDVRIPVIIELDAEKITEKGVQLDLDDPRTMENLIRQGLRARLSTESIVTGLLYVSLDFHPGTPIDLVKPPNVPYQEIPTLPTILEEAQTAASEIIAKFQEIDLAKLVDSATETMQSLNEILRSPTLRAAVESLDGTVENLDRTVASIRKLAEDLNSHLGGVTKSLERTAGEATRALEEARLTLEALRELAEPGSPLTHQIGKTMEDVAAAARAFRNLAEYLERNPSAILRGRGGDEER
ncbi:MAG: paraquat-inducible protein B [Candidatus Binatia bacterium]|nr:MAG: paraquat-inducible protein B [Candidatus Binatia bacterium]